MKTPRSRRALLGASCLTLTLSPLALGQAKSPAPAPAAARPGAKPDARPDEKRDDGKAGEARLPGGAADVVALPPPKVDPQLFNRALQDFFIKDTRNASQKLYTYLSGTSSTDENHAWAQYFLARSLADLGLWHGSGYYLARVARERSNPAVLPRALEELRTLVDRPHNEVMIDEQIFGTLDLGFLPDTVAGFAHYQQGLLSLRVGNERWAQTHFARLPEASPEASKAKFAMVVTRLREHEANKTPAEPIIADFEQLAEDKKLDLEARNEARLAVARLRYERREFDKALEWYGKVKLPELDPGRASLYLEEAWTRYHLGELRASMGILTALDSPRFRDEFLPDKYLLRAMVFRDLCHYLPAKRAAKELTRRFADSLEAIRERQDLTQDLRLRRAAESHGGTKKAARYLEQLKLEAERIGAYSGAFGAPLTAHLQRMYALEIAEATRVYENRLRESVRVEADKLLRGAEQVRLMDYEVGLKLYERIKRGARITAQEPDVPIGPTQVAFNFEGEYWNDELRSYRYAIQSRCIEEEGR